MTKQEWLEDSEKNTAKRGQWDGQEESQESVNLAGPRRKGSKVEPLDSNAANTLNELMAGKELATGIVES